MNKVDQLKNRLEDVKTPDLQELVDEIVKDLPAISRQIARPVIQYIVQHPIILNQLMQVAQTFEDKDRN